MLAIHEAQQPSVTRYLLLIQLGKREEVFLLSLVLKLVVRLGDATGF